MAGETGITIDDDEVKANLLKLRNLARDKMNPELMWETGQAILGAAQKRTPVLTGFLQNSAISEPARPQLGVFDVDIGFNASYAAAVHERTDLSHGQGEHHYLSNAINIDGPEILRKQVEHARRKFGL